MSRISFALTFVVVSMLINIGPSAIASPEYAPLVQKTVTITPHDYKYQKRKIYKRDFRHKKRVPPKTMQAKRPKKLTPTTVVTTVVEVKKLNPLEFGEFDGIPLDVIEMLPKQVLSAIIAARAKSYLASVTTPGGTMLIYGKRILTQRMFDAGATDADIEKALKNRKAEIRRLGIEYSINMLHDVFAIRLARAIRQARSEGLSGLGVFSAFRDPTLGIGGFRNKNDSTHAGGIAVDVTGIDDVEDAKRWQIIANANGLYLPYGPYNRAERNHTQLMMIASTKAIPALRKQIVDQRPKAKKFAIDRIALWRASGVKLDFIEPVSVKQVAYIGMKRKARKTYVKRIRRSLHYA